MQGVATMTDRLLSLSGVVCPVCHAALLAELPGRVSCASCGRAYPVRDELPVRIRGESVPPCV